MKRYQVLFFSLIVLVFPMHSHAQLWSGILKPTSGTGACSFGQVSSAGQCAIDWTSTGIPGGIPTNWTQSGSTIAASACGSDCTSTIQSALNACAGSSLPGKYVMLGAGTFVVASGGGLSVPNYCYLVGSGPQNTIVSCRVTSGACVHMGAVNDAPYKGGTIAINSGATAGSTSLVLNSTDISSRTANQGLAAGGYLVISELNNPVYVSSGAPQNPGGCGYCDVLWSGTRLREQIVEIESVTGSGPYTVTISPALYTNYGTAAGTAPAYATPFGALNGGKPDCKYCGLESLQLYASGYGLSAGIGDINMTECAYCWVENVEANYTDGDFLDDDYGYRSEIRNNYFFNGYGHGAGGTDNYVGFTEETSASQMINNIIERGHVNVEVDLGAAGNVIAYNYTTGAVDAVATNVNELDYNQHGAYPQFNLWEGNVGANFQPDSWHGNNGYNTAFRNWWTGSSLIATYPQEAITSGSCSGGTCTINWASGASNFYAGTYISIFGTNQTACGTGSLSTPITGVVWQLSGSSGQLSSTFSSGSCSSWTGGYAMTMDLSHYPTPIPHTGIGALSWTSTYNTYQGMWAMTLPAFSSGNNLIGNVLGSSQWKTTVGTSKMFIAGSGCTSCLVANTLSSTATRSYSGVGYAATFDYDTSGDSSGNIWSTFAGGSSGSQGYWSNQGYITTCYSMNFDAGSASTIQNINCTAATTLPPSFFLATKPAWWGSVAWPAIGPDVSGGPDSAVGGHANYNPAEACYNNLGRDSSGAKQFDANSCYNTTQPPPPTSLIGSPVPQS